MKKTRNIEELLPNGQIITHFDCKPSKVDPERHLRYLCQERNLSVRQYLEIHNIMNNHLITLNDWLSLPGTPKQKFISDITKLRKLIKKQDGVTMRRIAGSFHLRSHPNFPYNW